MRNIVSGLLVLGFGVGCGGLGEKDPTEELEACADESVIDEQTLIAWDFKQSAHEMLVCGQLSMQLQTSLFEAAESLLTDPKGAPDAFTWSEDSFLVETEDVVMEVALSCGDGVGCPSGERLTADPFLLDSYVQSGSTSLLDSGAVELTFEAPGPLVRMLGHGANPESPLRLTATELASFAFTIQNLQANTVIHLNTQEEDTTVVYDLKTGRAPLYELALFPSQSYELLEASATRGAQVMEPELWDVEVLEHGMTGVIQMLVTGGDFDYAVTYTYSESDSEPVIEMECR